MTAPKLDKKASIRPAIPSRRQKRLNQFLTEFSYSDEYLRELTKHVQNQIHCSYNYHKDHPFDAVPASVSQFLSLDTCVSSTPSGSEKGIFYGIDVGGTNLRVVRCDLQGKGSCEIDAVKHDIRRHDIGLPKGLLDAKCTASQLMDFIADACNTLIVLHRDQDRRVSMGFTFSFAIQMVLIDQALVMDLSKGFETGSRTVDPLIGQDVVAMLNHAFKRKNMKAVVSGCLNDTTGTLLTAAYEAGQHPDLPPVRIGMIVGTGFNTCVVDEKALSYGYQGSLINLESGALVAKSHLVDLKLDAETSNPGKMNAEKKISGGYLSEVTRHALIFVLESDAPARMFEKGSIETYQTAEIFNVFGKSECVSVVNDVMEKAFDWVPSNNDYSALIAEVVHAVWNRSAGVVAAIMAGCAEQTERLRKSMGGLTVGVDGSVYQLNPLYQKRIRQHLNTILGSRSELLYIVETADGSGKGAGMLACAISRTE